MTRLVPAALATEYCLTQYPEPRALYYEPSFDQAQRMRYEHGLPVPVLTSQRLRTELVWGANTTPAGEALRT